MNEQLNFFDDDFNEFKLTESFENLNISNEETYNKKVDLSNFLGIELTESIEGLTISGKNDRTIDKKRGLENNDELLSIPIAQSSSESTISIGMSTDSITKILFDSKENIFDNNGSNENGYRTYVNDLNVSLNENFQIDLPKKKSNPSYGKDDETNQNNKFEYYESSGKTLLDEQSYIQDNISIDNSCSNIDSEPSSIHQNIITTSIIDLNIDINNNSNSIESYENLNKTQNIRLKPKLYIRNMNNICKNNETIDYHSMPSDKLKNILKKSHKQKISYDHYDIVYMCYINNNPYALEIISDELPTEINLLDLIGKIYIVKRDLDNPGKPYIKGIDFHSYEHGHYSSKDRNFPICCKLVVCISFIFF